MDAPKHVIVDPSAVAYMLERADLSATQTAAAWSFVPPKGAWFAYVQVAVLPSAGTLTSVRLWAQARRDYVQGVEIAYGTPATGEAGVLLAAVPVVVDGQQTMQVFATSATGSVVMQASVILVPASASFPVVQAKVS